MNHFYSFCFYPRDKTVEVKHWRVCRLHEIYYYGVVISRKYIRIRNYKVLMMNDSTVKHTSR